MRTRVICSAIIVLLAGVPRLAVSQQDSAPSKPINAVQPPPPRHYYKLNFLLRETDDGKVPNQRSFSMDVSDDPREWWNMRSGTRIPFSGSKDVNYIDVGVNLDVRAEAAPDGLLMQVTSEISSVASETGVGVAAPALRQLKVKSAVLAPVGKPTTVFAADDAASKHRFELEVTPTRAR
jgi:hypothetical protein